MHYLNREQAGRELAEHLSSYRGRNDVTVLALPRGGVPIAVEVAKAMAAPWDVFLVRKLGAPGQEELAFGAIAEGGLRVVHEPLTRALGLSPADVDAIADRERGELDRRRARYRGGRNLAPLDGRVALIVDDGLATGATMEAAIQATRGLNASQVVVAAPVGASDTCARLATIADEVVCPLQPDPFDAVGLWYVDFTQVTDAEVEAMREQRSSKF